jgi:hypothetical protein
MRRPCGLHQPVQAQGDCKPHLRGPVCKLGPTAALTRDGLRDEAHVQVVVYDGGVTVQPQVVVVVREVLQHLLLHHQQLRHKGWLSLQLNAGDHRTSPGMLGADAWSVRQREIHSAQPLMWHTALRSADADCRDTSQHCCF